MKKINTLFITATIVATAIFTSCSSPSEKVENADAEVEVAKEDLANAEYKYSVEVENFKKQTDEKIDSMPTPEPAVSASSPDKSGLPGGIPGGVSNIVTPTNPGEGPGLAEGDPKITDFPEIDPEFSGNLESFLSKSTKYPPKAVEEGVEGQVFVCFIIDENGKVTKPEVLKGIGFGCDEEALRVIKSLPDWKPGKMNGHPVKVRMRVPFKFRLK